MHHKTKTKWRKKKRRKGRGEEEEERGKGEGRGGVRAKMRTYARKKTAEVEFFQSFFYILPYIFDYLTSLPH